MLILLLLIYIFLTCTIFLSSSIYIIYYCLELQWMLLLIFFIIGTSIYRGLLINKTYSRYIDSIFMLDFIIRSILILFILSNLNVPGSINFIGELLSFISIISIDSFYIIIFLFTSFLNSWFWFLILNRKLTYNYSYTLCVNALIVLIWLLVIIFYLGYYFLFL